MRYLTLLLIAASTCTGAEPLPVALKAGQVAPYAGQLLSPRRAATLSQRLEDALTRTRSLRAALDARSVEATALRSSVTLHEEREARYKAEADRAVQAAGAAKAEGKVQRAKGVITGIGIGHIAVKAISALVGWLF